MGDNGFVTWHGKNLVPLLHPSGSSSRDHNDPEFQQLLVDAYDRRDSKEEIKFYIMSDNQEVHDIGARGTLFITVNYTEVQKLDHVQI